MTTLFAEPGGEFYYPIGNSGQGVLVPLGVWTSSDNTFSGRLVVVNNAPAGRTPASDNNYYAISMGATNSYVSKTFAASYGHMITGVAMYFSNGVFVANKPLISFGNSGALQCDIRTTDISGHVSCSRNGTLIGTVSTQLLSAGWHYFELDTTFATTAAGTADFWVDGVRWLHNTSVQTANTVATANQITFYSIGTTAYAKDIYVTDGVGGPYGDISVLVKYPTGAGVNSTWSANTGTAVSCVQDGVVHTGVWPDSDGTYIFDSTTNDISDFTHQTLSLNGQIKSIVHLTYMRKDDAGSRSVSQICLSATATELSASISLGNSYTYYWDFLDVDPNTTTGWTVSGYNAATFGVKEIT